MSENVPGTSCWDQHDPQHLTDIDYLERILKRTVRKDPRALARSLLTQFGGFAETLNASTLGLRRAKVPNATINDFQLLQSLPERVLRSSLRKREIFSSHQDLLKYCRASMAFKDVEHFRILYLNARHRLIADEIQNKGTIDHVIVYPREVMTRALELNAKALFLIHNHPSGDPQPSRVDIDSTHNIIQAGTLFGISVVDHLIIGKNSHVSMKELQII